MKSVKETSTKISNYNFQSIVIKESQYYPSNIKIKSILKKNMKVKSYENEHTNKETPNNNARNNEFERVVTPPIYRSINAHKKKLIISLVLGLLGFIIIPASIQPNVSKFSKCNPKIHEIISKILPLSSNNPNAFMINNISDVEYNTNNNTLWSGEGVKIQNYSKSSI